MLGLFALLNQCKPDIKLSNFVKEEGSERGVSGHDVVNEVHKHNEHDNPCKFDENCEKVLDPRASSVVAVACGWDNRADPVKGKYVQLIAVVRMEQGGLDSPGVALVAHQVKISHPKPDCHN